jgi:catechol 2,3-dioxygenase-like lactoylglutathione lyase family enzyme
MIRFRRHTSRRAGRGATPSPLRIPEAGDLGFVIRSSVYNVREFLTGKLLTTFLDAIFGRIKKAGLSYGSAPWSLDDGKLNDWNGGRGVYFKDPNGHMLELMTMPQ